MLDDVKAWLSNKHIWLQEAAYRILTKTSLSETDISELIEIIKNKSTTEKKDFPTTKIEQDNNIKLLSIGPVVGIDKLNSRTPLELGKDNLSVIYGQNGSGKSGYVRILKNICGKSYSPNLKSDVYSTPPSRQSCLIKYFINDQSKELEWVVNTQPVSDLLMVDIFDTNNGSIYLENETEVSYLPSELVFFTELVNICERMKIILNGEEQKLVSTLPEIPENFKNTVCAGQYNNLQHNTTQSELEKLLSFLENDEKEITLLKQRLLTDDPLTMAIKQKAIKEQIERIKTKIEEIINAVNNEALNDIRQELENSKQKRKNADEGARVLNSITKLDGIGNETWRALWEAARQYSTINAYIGQTFPNIETGARCPLCHQELDDNAKERFQRFESFVQGSLELEAKEAEKVFLDTIKNLPEYPTEADLTSMCQAAGLDDSTSKEIDTIFVSVRVALENLKKHNIPDNDSIDTQVINKLIKKLSDLSNNADKSASQFEEDAKLFDRNKTQNELIELEARQWISQQKKAVEAEIERLKEIEKYQEWKKQTDTTKITKEANVISEKLITQAYITRFNDELRKLGASAITVELVKAKAEKGRSKYRICLKNLVDNNTTPKEILSDGEKRIVSIAAFLADVTGHNISTPFVFDDPISSLDQEYEEKVIERLVELSKERQVIVFTHRLSFLSIIEDKVENLNSIHIYCTPWGTTGELDDFSIDKKKPQNAMIFLRDERLSQARKAYKDKDINIYTYVMTATCSDFRKLIERFVEIILLADVVQRHRRAINTKGKIQNLAKIIKSDCDLIDDMMSKYSCFEHSQSKESPVKLPPIEEIEEDINKMINWHSEFVKRTISK
jgi:energy-coupling factor transporter ATP-binding protein EcfA2